MAARTRRTVGMVAIAAALAGCATARVPAELVTAREAVDRARTGDAARVDPADVELAREALSLAERMHEDGDPRARDLAYVAARRAELAEARATAVVASAQAEEADTTLKAELAARARRGEEEAARARALAEHERAARMEAERLAREALRRLQDVAVTDEARGTVITIPGEVLFPSGQAALRPGARERLDAVAEALKASDQRVLIEGHTDSSGKAASNLALSQRRAEAVRDYLVSRGLAAGRIEASGAGSSRPIASNASPEGRANNRRVEIILVPAAGATPGGRP